MSDFIYLGLCLITCISCSSHVQSEINPAAKIIKSISAETFNNTFDNIYTNFGSPTTHGTDNGLPFNLQQFTEYSDQKGIKYNVYPYHPQPNTVETLKKPMGKAMKIPHSKHQNRTKNCMLTSYRTTPHIETSQAPRKLTFQHGFQYHFPIAKSTTSNQISKAHRKHLEQQQKRKNIMHPNTPKHFAINKFNLFLPKTLCLLNSSILWSLAVQDFIILFQHSNSGAVSP